MELISKVDGYESIYAHKSFYRDFEKVTKHSGKGFEQWVDRQFQFLDTGLINDLLKDHASFEKLNCDSSDYNLYAIRRPQSEGNPRIIFSVIDYSASGDGIRILLLAFNELHGNSDYKKNIPTAINRIEQVLGIQ